MGIAPQVSADEYLRMSFDGVDREYVHGEIVERPMPISQHGEIQALVCFFLVALAKRLRFRVTSETRHALIQRELYRIPDVALYASDAPLPLIPCTPPLVAIEILSPDDNSSNTLRKLFEYKTFGVEHIWVIDPVIKALYVFDASGLKQVNALELPQYSFRLTLQDLELN
jgi:Uma2 family endonuclease